MPARRSRLCPTRTSTRAWTGSAERTPNVACFCLLPAMLPNTSASRSPMRVLSECFKRGPISDLDKSLEWFGGKNTERGVLLFVTRHAAEHLGQSIAYARFIGVVPPWTEDAQKQQKQKTEAAPKTK